MKKRRKHLAIPALCALLGMFCLSGCSSSALSVGKKAEKGYSMPQILVIASTERKRYEDVCTDQIWDVMLAGEDKTFGDYLKSQLRTFLDEMKIMNLMAEERDIRLTPQEQTAMSEAAQEYYGALTAADREHMELTEEEVLELYEDYCMAEKLVQELTEGMNLEVSDSEAKVIVVQEVKTEERQAAETLQAAASEEGADFSALAEAAGLTVTERSLGRKEESAAYEEAAFSLSAGEVSVPVEKDGSYYVIKCVNEYDREATALRKEQIYTNRRQKAFRDLYDSYCQEIRISYSGVSFETLQMKTEKVAEEADFFEIYQKHIQ